MATSDTSPADGRGPVRRYLIVANQTLGGEHLARAIRERLARGPCRFHVVVPATPPAGRFTWTEEGAHRQAEERLGTAVDRLRILGAAADGEVGDANPVAAVGDVLRSEEPFDEIILSTLPPGRSRWLKADLPRRLRAITSVEVTHVAAAAEEPIPIQG